MNCDFKQYLDSIKFDKYLKRLSKKLKNKKVIVYGSGSLFQYIKENYDLTSINICGISDMKFAQDDKGKECLGYKIVPKSELADEEFDVLLVALQNYVNVIDDFEANIFAGKKIKVYPLARIPLWGLIKQIWSQA